MAVALGRHPAFGTDLAPGDSFFAGKWPSSFRSLRKHDGHLAFTHDLKLDDGTRVRLTEARFFSGTPRLTLIEHTAYLVRNAPSDELLVEWLPKPYFR